MKEILEGLRSISSRKRSGQITELQARGEVEALVGSRLAHDFTVKPPKKRKLAIKVSQLRKLRTLKNTKIEIPLRQLLAKEGGHRIRPAPSK